LENSSTDNLAPRLGGSPRSPSVFFFTKTLPVCISRCSKCKLCMCANPATICEYTL